MRFCADVGLRAVRVRKEIPGFLWNRVWFALLREMLHLVDVGAADPVELDSMVQTTLRAFIPVFGPLQMTDLIGHDTLRDISDALYPELAADQSASTTIEQHVKDGRLGVKTGRGFYDDNAQRIAELSSKHSRIASDLDTERPDLSPAVRPRQCAPGRNRTCDLRITSSEVTRGCCKYSRVLLYHNRFGEC
jgi:3-hydroxyacyl-CoA dehydrogenase